MTWQGIPPLRFGQTLPGEVVNSVPPGILVKPSRRRQVMLHKAADVVPHLPGPGEALHALMTGEYDLMHLLIAVLESKPEAVQAMRVATLSYNARNLAEMLQLLDSGKVRRLSLITSHYMSCHDKGLWETTLAEFREWGMRAAAPRSHVKVVTVHFDDGAKLALEGSANLRTNKNREQFMLASDPGLHDWHTQWIDQLVASHEGDEG